MSVPSVSRQFGRITRLDKELGRSASWAVAAGGIGETAVSGANR